VGVAFEREPPELPQAARASGSAKTRTSRPLTEP
jgi:hypothetical protein